MALNTKLFIMTGAAGIATVVLFGETMLWFWGGVLFCYLLGMLYFLRENENRLLRVVHDRTRELTDVNRNLKNEIVRHRETEAILRDREKKYRLLAEYSNDIIWTTDLELKFTYVSPSVERIRGFTPDETIRQGMEEVLTPDSLEKAFEMYARTMEQEERGEKVVTPTILELEHICRDGRTIWMEVSMSMIRDESGRPVGITGLSRDITERRKGQEQLLRSEKLAALGEMVAGVAHEISTPLGAGLLSASYAKDTAEDLRGACWTGGLSMADVGKYSEKIKDAASAVVSNLERASELLNSFKNVAVDQVAARKRKFNMKVNMEETLHSLKPRFRHTSHRIVLHCPGDLVIRSYPGMYSQITTNLVMNALIHGFEGIDSGEIVITVEKQDHVLTLSFRDTGRGMEAAVLQKIFDPFFTTRRNRGGTGLGLHIVHNLVCRNLMGQITCSSSPGKGTEFLIKVPFHNSG